VLYLFMFLYVLCVNSDVDVVQYYIAMDHVV